MAKKPDRAPAPVSPARNHVCRLADERDLGNLEALFKEVLAATPYYNETAKSHEISKYTVGELRRKLEADPESILVAGTVGDLAGFAFTHLDDLTVWIDWFGVHPKYQGNGLGTALLSTILEQAPHRGSHKVWCDTRTTNEPSISILKSLGFKHVATIPDHWYRQDFDLWQRWVDDL